MGRIDSAYKLIVNSFQSFWIHTHVTKSQTGPGMEFNVDSVFIDLLNGNQDIIWEQPKWSTFNKVDEIQGIRSILNKNFTIVLRQCSRLTLNECLPLNDR